jgi:amino acid adenylation domain-containing protein
MLVNEFLENSAKNLPDKVALVCQNRRFTYRQLDNMSNSLANAFISLGLARQDRVGIYLENSTESVVSIFATLKAGGVFVVINPQVKSKKLEYILKNCQAKILVTDVQHLENISDILINFPEINYIVVTDTKTLAYSSADALAGLCVQVPMHLRTYAFIQLLNSYPTTQPQKNCVDIDLASLIYTSGSTGDPKGAMFTHLNMASAANSVIEYLKNTDDDIILNCLPLSFGYGLYQVLMAFKFAGTIVLEKSFVYPYQVIDLIIKEKVTGFPLVPTISAILLQLNKLSKYDFSSLRYITNAAQALPPKHIFRLRELLPHVKIYSMYGLTECKRVSYLAPEEIEKRPTSVGKAMPNTEAYIVDENGNRVNEPDVIGELVVRGRNVMKGYWNLPEETAKRLKTGASGEKVLYTGDLFKMDEEGYLYFVSRKDDIIKTVGEMVSPKEVEDVLYEIEGVFEAAVIGVPDDILGNAIKAFVVLHEGSQLTEQDIILHCQKYLESFMMPKYIEFRKELPKTTTGKIRKVALRES